MLSIYDLISVVPEGWQESGDLSEYASDIELSCLRMVEENYADKYPGIYSIISSWRAEDDLFDILYSYFFSTDNTYALKDLYSLGMPKKL